MSQGCRHMLMSALPMTQFRSAGSSAYQYSCGPTAAFTLVRLADEPSLQNWVIGSVLIGILYQYCNAMLCIFLFDLHIQ